ncbi:type VII secretion protein EccCa [Solicola sp. PLA-1-18]|uniref:type VII secretion protein EccCa n=1 Tax=Solicola sp. PLA-1-18 TaxID=3380532 RepID=UPI003B79F8DC
MTTTLVRRPPRTQPPPLEVTDLSIVDPPARSEKSGGIAGLGMIMMPVMAGVGSLTVAITNRRSPILVIAAVMFMVGALAVGILMVVSQRSGAKRAEREGRERYLDYVEQLRHAVRAQIAAQRAEQAWRHPHPRELIDLARDPARRWERRAQHGDFLALRLGTGTVPLVSGLRLDADTGPLNTFDPVCLESAKELQSRYASLSDQPITLDLKPVSHLSLAGDPRLGRAVASSLVAQLATLHSPLDLKIALVRPDAAAADWDWVKWLPHVQHTSALDGDLTARLVAGSVAGMQELLAEELEARLDRRQRSRGSDPAPQQHLVVVVDADGLVGPHQLEAPDASTSLASLGIHVVTIAPTPREEPESLDDRLMLRPDGSAVLASRPDPFTLDQVDPGVAVVVSRQLAPLRLTAEDDDGEGLEQTVGLPEVLGVPDAARLPLGTTWRARPLRELLRVPIGVGTDGRVVSLDLKESAHGGMGPHGLVVGATGSGKSEMLRTLVSSLLIGHGPDRLALMLVDFKGGATFAAMEGIPHMAGMITNLQDDLTLVDRMRDALYGEMQRRQEVLKKAGNLPNVTTYQDRIDAGEDLEPLPHLLVIVDEFSELLTAKPDFAELFVAIGRIGRSIGVHLLLASQKLETGKIRGLESHLSYRIGLRTFSEGESRDAIGVPDAYHLPPEPGAGYLKVDTTVFERFKAALVSAPYTAPSDGPRTTVPVVPYVAGNGLGRWIAQQSAAAGTDAEPSGDAGGTSVLDLICDQLRSTGAAAVRPVWLEPLPRSLPLGELLELLPEPTPTAVHAPLGLVDDAGKQAQFPLSWDFTGGGSNLVVAGSPASGKSVLLATMMGGLSLRHAPGDVVFYCIDYGGGLLQGLADLPHVASVVTRVDPERIQRTINDVVGILNGREDLFREHGLTSMRQLRQARADGTVPRDVPADVFLVVDGWGTFRDEHDHLENTISDVAARGQNYGVHVVLSVTQGMQIRMRMQAAFGGRVELRLTDAFDSEFDRKLMEQVPKDVPGRGLTDVAGDHLFQTALPSLEAQPEGADASAGVPALVAAVTERWGDQRVARVRTLPELVRVGDLPVPEPGDDLVAVGLSELNLGPAAVNLFGSSPHLLVLGDGETGKTNLLKLLARGLMKSRTPQEIGFLLVDTRRSLLDVVPEEYLLGYATTAEEAAQGAGEIAAAVRERIPGRDVTAEQLRNRSWWKGLDVVVLVDDLDLVVTSAGNPLAPFTDLVPQGRDLGFHLVMSRRVGGMSRALYEPLVQRLADVGTPGFMFSGDRSEGRILNNVAPTRLSHGRAFYVPRGGGASQVQVALDDRDA